MQKLCLSSSIKTGLFTFLVMALSSITVFSQSCPEQGTVIFPDLSGGELYDALIAEYKTNTTLSYDEARETMYSEIDNQDGFIIGVYTGYRAQVDPNSSTPRQDAFAANINAEHTWPQSKGATEGTLAHSDMHMLRPAYSGANSSRSNRPFIDIPDDETIGWWRYDQQVTTPVADSIDLYSERRDSHPSEFYGGSWEPREDFKGDAARGLFYFYTMYRDQADQADPNFFNVQKDYLRIWNSIDSVSQREYTRTCMVAPYQQNKVNPFVIDPTLVDRLFFEGQENQTVVEFSSSALTLEEGDVNFMIDISIINPNPDTATTVDVIYAGGSATPDSDFDAFSPQTVTFPAGAGGNQTVMLSIKDDEEVEMNEDILFTMENVSGPANSVVGVNDSLTVTLRDNDGAEPETVWINEFHYDNDGTDTGEFVEIAVDAEFADLSNITLTLYNGSNGSVYNTFPGDEFVMGESENGFTVYYLELPSNGLQNGSPDGMSLDLDGTLVQFLSYEGTLVPEEGAAEGYESEDVGVEESNESVLTSSVSLSGTGSSYADFSWQVTETSTMGAINTGQTFEKATSTEEGSQAVTSIKLHQNYPNPFNPTTQISFDLAKATSVKLEVYNITGQKVAQLADGYKSSGSYTFTFDASNLSSGFYFYQLKTAETVAVKKMLLMK